LLTLTLIPCLGTFYQTIEIFDNYKYFIFPFNNSMEIPAERYMYPKFRSITLQGLMKKIGEIQANI
jgi:hypothetical protein